MKINLTNKEILVLKEMIRHFIENNYSKTNNDFLKKLDNKLNGVKK